MSSGATENMLREAAPSGAEACTGEANMPRKLPVFSPVSFSFLFFFFFLREGQSALVSFK